MALRPTRVAIVIAGCAALVGAVAPTANAQVYWQPAAGSDRAAVDGSAPAWATPSAKIGSANGATQRHVQIALGLRDERGAEALARAESTPGSPRYRTHLSAAQFTARFASTDQTVQQVSAWLRSQGLQVAGVSANHHFIDATARNDVLERAFATPLATYRYTALDGVTRDLVAPETAVSLPKSIRAAVTAVVGLDDSAKTIRPQQQAMSPFGGPGRSATGVSPAAPGQTCAHYWGESNNTSVPQAFGNGDQSNTLCGYLTGQVRGIYGLSAGNTGAGVTVGLVGAYNLASAAADANHAAADFGNVALAPGQYTTVEPQGGYQTPPGCDSPDAWGAEQDLDIQSVHTMAPGAKILWYAGSDCDAGIYTALNQAITANNVGIISNSWLVPSEDAIPAATRDQLNSMVVQAAVQGQSVLFSSGDAGDNSQVKGNTSAQPGFPASNPWVTAVGGTSVGLNANGSTKFVTGWEDGGSTLSNGQWSQLPDGQGHFAGGAGGGVSHVYAAPDYQSGVVPAAVAGGHRAVPDVSMLASAYTGMAVGFTSAANGYIEFPSGGTSLASPLLAGLVADTAQAQQADRVGFLNPAIYALGSTGIADVTPHAVGVWTPGLFTFGNVAVPTTVGDYLVSFDSHPESLQSGSGWDQVTGVGTPNAQFVTQLGN